MKLVCTQENFRKGILSTERIVSKQNTLPILNNILLEAKKGGLVISATNLEIGAVVKLSAKVEKEGRITIPVKTISSFINNLPQGEQNLSLELLEQGLKITNGNSKAIIKGLNADDFPLIPKKSSDFILKISSISLKNALSRVMTCVAFNEARQELTGINLILTEKEISFAATDSFRLAESKILIDEKNINRDNYLSFLNKANNLIIPSNTINEVLRMIALVEGEMGIAIEDGQIFFEVEGIRLVSRLISGKYPEYKHIMPKEYKTRAVGERTLLQSLVKIASVFTISKTSEISLKIDSKSSKLIVGARSVEVGENTSEANFDITGPSQEVVFNSKYILDGLNTINTSQTAILMNSESTPVALKEIDEKTGEVLDDYIYIVMPIKN